MNQPGGDRECDGTREPSAPWWRCHAQPLPTYLMNYDILYIQIIETLGKKDDLESGLHVRREIYI